MLARRRRRLHLEALEEGGLRQTADAEGGGGSAPPSAYGARSGPSTSTTSRPDGEKAESARCRLKAGPCQAAVAAADAYPAITVSPGGGGGRLIRSFSQ